MVAPADLAAGKRSGMVSVRESGQRSENPLFYDPAAPEWRNWQTRQTQNLVQVTLGVGSIPTSGRNLPFVSFSAFPCQNLSNILILFDL